MDMPQLTPQRQKMLIGAAAAGLLLVLGFSISPGLELADAGGVDEVDEVLAIVDDDRVSGLVVSEGPAPRAFRRARAVARAIESEAAANATDAPAAISPTPKARDINPAPDPESLQVIPPSYQQRLALLAEEEEALLRHQKRQRDQISGPRAAPIPTVTVASAEDDLMVSSEVEQALAQSRRPGRMRRVELIDGDIELPSAGRATDARGARLSGVIEVD